MTFGFALVLAGFILLDAGWKGTTPTGVLQGLTQGKKGAGGVLAEIGQGVTTSVSGSGGEEAATASGPHVKGGKLTPAGIASGVAKATAMSGKYPYVWGGGHSQIGKPSTGTSGSMLGYDCSGAVSAVLGAMGVLSTPLVSGQLASWGESGPGKFVTVYANATHTFMNISGVWFGTGSDKQANRGGPAWGNHDPELAAYSVRHPKGG
jgi:hypothetical protein